MRIYNINPIKFTGQRQDRKTVSQLKQDNKYDLNLINQRNITEAIDSLAKTSDEDNIRFLIDVGENLKYGTNIDLGKKSYNDWKTKLLEAIDKSISNADEDVKERLSERVEKLKEIHPLTKTEEEILELRKSLLDKVDYEQLENIPSNNIKSLPSNLDYFIVSSEVPTVQKLYVLKRLNYFMSDEYKIDPQLADKKTQALAEIVNDIVIDTPESEIPNIKAVNQRQHGSCAAISICRKALAYEDKPNFVDMVMSELDANPYMMVYDISKLGTNTKIKTPKTELDFDYALSKGYRIIDASALYWMNIGDTEFSKNEAAGMYSPFDKYFFDTFHDSHLLPDFKDEELVKNQEYYKALLKAKEAIGAYKRSDILKKYKKSEHYRNREDTVNQIKAYNKRINQLIQQVSPDITVEKRRQIVSDLHKLEVKDSESAEKITDYKKDFLYLSNETNDVKAEKIKAFLSVSLDGKNTKILNKNISEILDLIEVTNGLANIGSRKESYSSREIQRAKALYNAAGAYRTSILTRLEVPDEMIDLMVAFGVKDRESLIIDNMEELAQKYDKAVEEKGKLEILSNTENLDDLPDDEKPELMSKTQRKKNYVNEEISKTLAKNFQTENDPEILSIALRENKNSLEYLMTDWLDDFYKATLAVSRKNLLSEEIEMVKNAVDEDNTKVLLGIAKNLQTKPNKKAISKQLGEYIKILKSDNCTNEQYLEIYNRVGKRNQMEDCADNFKKLYRALFIDKDERIIKGFNQVNGYDPDVPLEITHQIYNELGERFNTTSMMISSLQKALEVRTENGNILNTVIGREIILKKLENVNEIVSENDLRRFQKKFNKIDSLVSSYSGERMKMKDLPVELRTFTPHEKEVLDSVETVLPYWYRQTTRALNLQYKQIEGPLSELNRDVGVKTGESLVWTEGDSGLMNRQQVKIIEHMTDRPYYIEENTRYALNKLKRLPYSGISSTSVDHKSPAYHAQYIADIKPVPVINIKGKVEEKEAVFHDNTWGPCEHENTWTDRNGMLRTDYAREFGGVNGYITDNKYLSGKLSDNMVGRLGTSKPQNINSKRYKRLAGNMNQEYKYPMFNDVITSGESPLAKSHVIDIRQATLINPLWYFKDLEKAASQMSYYDVKETINKVETMSVLAYDEFERIEKRVFGKPPFDKGIRTKKDYDNLPADDPLKVLFEQIAIIKSYSDIPDMKIFYKKYTSAELVDLKGMISKEARKNFNYTFGKNPEIAVYGAERSRKMVTAVLKNFLKENNINLTKSQEYRIINALKAPDRTQFDGSLTKTTVLMSESFAQCLSKSTPDFEDKQEKIEMLKDDVQKFLYDKMVFTNKDMDNPELNHGKLKHVCAWIDNTFNPKTDEEFARIFRNLQEMTTEEFEQKYNSVITDKDMGIKNFTGYDILTRFRSLDERTYNSVLNTLYGRELGKNLKLTDTKPSYDYDKFEKILRGAVFEKGKRTFDDIYYDYYWSLYMLTVQDFYSKMRKNLFQQYGVFPAYPKVEYINEKEVTAMVQDLLNNLNDSVKTMDLFGKQDLSISIVKDLYEYMGKFEDSAVPDAKTIEHIKTNINQFLDINGDDDTLKDTLMGANNILDLPEDAPASEYKKNTALMWDEISMFEKTVDGKTIAESIYYENEIMRNRINDFVIHNFPKKYQDRAKGILYKYVSAKAAGRKDADDIFEVEFADLFDKHYMLRHPEQMLNEYLLLICKSKDGVENKATKDNIKKLREEIKTLKKDNAPEEKIDEMEKELSDLVDKEDVISTFSELLQGALASGNVLELEYIMMDCAKNANLNIVRDEYKNSTITLKDGRVVTLNSQEILNSILRPLIIGNNLETTMKFTESLNLEEEVAQMLMNTSNLDAVRKATEKIDNVYTAVSQQTQIVQDELDALEDIDGDPNYRERLEQAKVNILKKVKDTNYYNGYKIIDKAIEHAMNDIDKHKNMSKIALLHLHLENAKQASINAASDDAMDINEGLICFQYIVNFAHRLAPKLKEGTKTKEDFNEFIKKLYELDEFSKAHAKRYPNINIQTVNYDDPFGI